MAKVTPAEADTDVMLLAVLVAVRSAVIAGKGAQQLGFGWIVTVTAGALTFWTLRRSSSKVFRLFSRVAVRKILKGSFFNWQCWLVMLPVFNGQLGSPSPLD